MIHVHRILPLSVMLLASLLVASLAMARTDTLTIVHVNDTHSCLSPLGPRDPNLSGTRAGIARAASVIGMARATQPNVLVVHGGDFMIGDMFFNTTFGIAELRMLQALGLDAIAIGNHEFDLGPEVLGGVLDSLHVGGPLVSVISSNLLVPEELPALRRNIVSTAIKQVGNVRVGLFALTTPEANLISRPGPAALDTNVGTIAGMMAAQLRGQGCDIVICLSHLGYQYDRELAASVPGIDVIVSAHSHDVLPVVGVRNPSGDTTWIEQAGAFYSHVGTMQFMISNGRVTLLQGGLTELVGSIPEEPNTKAAVDGLVAMIEQKYQYPFFSHKIADATADFAFLTSNRFQKGWHDTPVGNLVADAERSVFQTDIAIVAGGSVAQPLYHGPLVPDDIYRTISYGFNPNNGLDYYLATFYIQGKELASGLEFGLSNIELDDQFLIQCSGMRYTYDPRKPAGSRLGDVTIGGVPLDASKYYSVTSNQFALALLAALGLHDSGAVVHEGDTTEFQVVSAYVANLGTISPLQEGRLEAIATLGIQQASPSAPVGITVFPNPSQQVIQVNLRVSSGRTTVTLVNMCGDEVYRSELRGSEGEVLTIPVADLPPGSYLLGVQSDAGWRSAKVIVK